jgi:hypothetical protein
MVVLDMAYHRGYMGTRAIDLGACLEHLREREGSSESWDNKSQNPGRPAKTWDIWRILAKIDPKSWDVPPNMLPKAGHVPRGWDSGDIRDFEYGDTYMWCV